MIVRRTLLKAALAATTKDDTRYYLSAVQVTPDGTVEATDGHLAVRLREPDAAPAEDYPLVPGYPTETAELSAPVRVSAALVATLCRQPEHEALDVLSYTLIRQRDTHPRVVAIGQTDLTVPLVTFADEGGPFPQLDRIIPAARGGAPLGLSVAVLDKLLKLLKTIKAPGVVFTVPPAEHDSHGEYRPTSAIRFAASSRLGRGVSVVGAVAPFVLNGNGLEGEYPACITTYSTLPDTGTVCAGCGHPIRLEAADGETAWIDETDGDACGASVHGPATPEDEPEPPAVAAQLAMPLGEV